MSENNICFAINNLEFGYNNKKKILKNINAEINSRALISLIGPNGSGKSTLLRTLSGIQAYTGSVKINNFEVKNLSRKNIGALIGVVPQNFRPAYPFSVWEVIAMGRLPHKNLFDRMKSEDENLIINAAKRLEIEHLLTRNIMSLSGGEAQRVLIACVLAQDPPVLLLDEPTSALDPNQAAKVFKLLRDLVKLENKTVIVIVHDINTSLEFSDYYLALKSGELISQGNIKDLDLNILRNLYNSDFEAYHNERGDVMWRALAE